MAQRDDLPAEAVLDLARRIAERLLDVQGRVNRLIDSTQAELLPDVRRQLGQVDADAVDLTGLVNTRIAGLNVVVTPEAVATVLPLSAASATTTRAGRRAVSEIISGADARL